LCKRPECSAQGSCSLLCHPNLLGRCSSSLFAATLSTPQETLHNDSMAMHVALHSSLSCKQPLRDPSPRQHTYGKGTSPELSEYEYNNHPRRSTVSFIITQPGLCWQVALLSSHPYILGTSDTEGDSPVWQNELEEGSCKRSKEKEHTPFRRGSCLGPCLTSAASSLLGTLSSCTRGGLEGASAWLVGCPFAVTGEA